MTIKTFQYLLLFFFEEFRQFNSLHRLFSFWISISFRRSLKKPQISLRIWWSVLCGQQILHNAPPRRHSVCSSPRCWMAQWAKKGRIPIIYGVLFILLMQYIDKLHTSAYISNTEAKERDLFFLFFTLFFFFFFNKFQN